MRLLALLAALLLLHPRLAAAQQPPTIPGVQRDSTGVTLDFQNADIRMVIGALADIAGLNVVFGTIPPQQVTLRTSGSVTPREVRGYLDALARAHGLEIVEESGLVRISGGAAAEAAGPAGPAYARPQAPGAGVRLYVYSLKHAQAEEIARTVGALFGISTMGGGGADGAAGPRSLSQELRQQRNNPYLQQPAAPVAVAAVAPAEAASSTGLTAGLQGSVQIVPDPRTNSLLIRSNTADYETLRSAIEALDVRPLQVLIEVLIAEVRRDRQSGLGITVGLPDQTDERTGITFGGALSGRDLGDVALRASGLGRLEVEVLLRALAASGEATILSRPVILAQNNLEARILVGSERPFVQLYRALPTDGAIRDQVVQYRDVGTQLTIRPTINQDGYVSMAVLQEISSATSEVQFGAPIISTREAQTELLVRDGRTAVIGGLVDQQTESTASGIPFLMDLPLIGRLFRSSQRRRDFTELFLFLTPHVIRGDAELDDATQLLRDNTQLLGRRLPDAIPLIQLPDSAAAPAPVPPQQKEGG